MSGKGHTSKTRVKELVREALEVQTSLTPEERRAYGEGLRETVPLASHATWHAPKHRPDPVALIKEQGETRLRQLLPLRYERMSASAFTFYRGGALIMASDLSHTPETGIYVQACGDAHLSNFGLFNSPERHTVFDINDFDETAPGPWEWDVKRLAASVEICGRDRAFTDEERAAAVLASLKGYCEGMRGFSHMGNLEVWYAHIDVDSLYAYLQQEGTPEERKVARKALGKAKGKDSVRAIHKLTEVVDGQLRIISAPPVVVPLRDVDELGGTISALDVEQLVKKAISAYKKTLGRDKRLLISQYSGVDIALKVVGVGSVGTRALILVMEGVDQTDPLVLQIKEAQESVLERFCGRSKFEQHGQRVVEGQRAIQAASDMLLGWCKLPGEDGADKHYYVRQLWDGKGTFVDLATTDPQGLATYAEVCGWTLAHAHARTGDRFAVAGYLGDGDEFSAAVRRFASAYADQNEADYARFTGALAAGELTGVA